MFHINFIPAREFVWRRAPIFNRSWNFSWIFRGNFYQTQSFSAWVSTATFSGRTMRSRAYIRWRRPRRSQNFPDEFPGEQRERERLDRTLMCRLPVTLEVQGRTIIKSISDALQSKWAKDQFVRSMWFERIYILAKFCLIQNKYFAPIDFQEKQ